MFYKKEQIENLCPTKRQIAAMESYVIHKSEKVQRRFAHFKAEVEKYWQLYPWLMVLAVAVCCCGCAETKYVIPNDTITQTNTQSKAYERDSIFIHDSVFVDRWRIGDTVFQDRITIHYKDRFLTKTDTLVQHDSTTVYHPVEVVKEVRKVPGFYKWCTGLFWGIIAVAIGYVVFRIIVVR